MVLLNAVNRISKDPAIIAVQDRHLLALRTGFTSDKCLVLHLLCAEVLRQQMRDDEVDDIVIIYRQDLGHLGKRLNLPEEI